MPSFRQSLPIMCLLGFALLPKPHRTYKTLINWRYPGYYDITGTDCKTNKFGYTTAAWHKENARLMKEGLYSDIKTLMTEYGKIDMLFWNGGWIAQQGSDRDGAPFWESYKYVSEDNQWHVNKYFLTKDSASGKYLGLIGMIRKYQPDILMNPRSGWIGDYTCDEAWQPVDNQYGFTCKDNKIYVWLLDGYKEKSLTLPPVNEGYKVKDAYILDSKVNIETIQKGNRITLKKIAPNRNNPTVMALEMNKNIH